MGNDCRDCTHYSHRNKSCRIGHDIDAFDCEDWETNDHFTDDAEE